MRTFNYQHDGSFDLDPQGDDVSVIRDYAVIVTGVPIHTISCDGSRKGRAQLTQLLRKLREMMQR